tara:strand:+ start:905 stop:1426 length:522 start_codon:yes stop_codon:yes gene_type:complete
MPLSHGMFLGASASGFDATIKFNGSYFVSSSGSNNRFDGTISGTLEILSDPKSIIQGSFQHAQLSSFELEGNSTYEVTVINNMTYTSNETTDLAGLSIFSITQSDGDPTQNVNYIEYATFQSGSLVNLQKQTITTGTYGGGQAPGLGFVIKRAVAGNTLTASNGLTLGITKTA